jgi:hypothetical protein
MIQGSCLCGGVRYEAEGPLRLFARCHCVQCRKASGGEFATNASVSRRQFRLVQGEELLREYRWRPGEHRVFCERCGSPLFKRSDKTPEDIRLRLGCVDTDIDARPELHVFVAEKPSWSEICDDLPQFATLPTPSSG